MLNTQTLHAFVPTLNAERARKFYGETLGLTLLSESPYALEFNANGTMLRVTMVRELTPHTFTVLGWGVTDITGTIRHLNSKGIIFQQFDGISQDALGIWTAPGGTKVAWFKDADGNLLSLAQQE